MEKIWSVLKSTGRDLLIAACVAGTIYLLVQVFDQGELPQDDRAGASASADCSARPDGAPCPSPPPASAPGVRPPAAQAPMYVTVTVAP